MQCTYTASYTQSHAFSIKMYGYMKFWHNGFKPFYSATDVPFRFRVVSTERTRECCVHHNNSFQSPSGGITVILNCIRIQHLILLEPTPLLPLNDWRLQINIPQRQPKRRLRSWRINSRRFRLSKIQLHGGLPQTWNKSSIVMRNIPKLSIGHKSCF